MESHQVPRGWVYFLTCEPPDFPIKIGFALSVKERVRSLQTALPYKVTVLAAIRGTMATERRTRFRFAPHRMRGEWFQRAPDLMEHIDRLKASPPPEGKRLGVSLDEFDKVPRSILRWIEENPRNCASRPAR